MRRVWRWRRSSLGAAARLASLVGLARGVDARRRRHGLRGVGLVPGALVRRLLILAALVPAAFAASRAPPPRLRPRRTSRKELGPHPGRTARRSPSSALRSSEHALGQDVSRLEDLDTDSRRRVERLQDVIRRAESRRSELKSRLDAASRVGGFWTAALSAESARHAAYQAGRSSFYGTSEIWADEYRRAAILEKRAPPARIEGLYSEDRGGGGGGRAEKAAEFADSRRAQAERDDRRKEYESKKAQLSLAQTQVAAAARRAKELEENAKALTALLDKLGKAAKYRKPAGVKAALDVPRHSLPWPADGKILTGFGREKDKDLGTSIVRQGLTLATPASARWRPLAGA